MLAATLRTFLGSIRILYLFSVLICSEEFRKRMCCELVKKSKINKIGHIYDSLEESLSITRRNGNISVSFSLSEVWPFC